MRRNLFRSFIVALLLAVLLDHPAASAAVRAETVTPSGPTLTIPSEYPAGAPGTVAVPIDFQGAVSGVASMVFSIDVESACLVIDTTGGKTVADSVIFHLPGQFRGSVSYDLNDVEGELDIAIADYAPPLSTLPDLAPLMTVTFTAICVPDEGETLISPLRFSAQPPPSFSNTISRNLPGIVVDGSVAIEHATPTPEPSDTPDPEPSETPVPVNTAPKARDDSAETTEYRPVTIAVLANDNDPDDDDLHVVEVTQAAFGTVTRNADDTITYLPDPGRNGVDLFTYTVGDGRGGLGIGSVTVDVAGVNIPPVAANDFPTTDEETELLLDPLDNDYDPDGAPDGSDLVLSVLGDPLHGTLNQDELGELRYVPPPDFHGEDRFSYAVTDTEGGTSVGDVVITVRPVNDPPSGAGIANRIVYLGEILSVQVDAHDVDGEASALTYVATGLPPGLTIDPQTGEIQGTVTKDAAGKYRVIVVVDDGEGTTEFTAVWQAMAPTAIHFGGLSVRADGDAIEVAWEAGSDGELTGFRVYRTTVAETDPNWVPVSQFIPATGQTGRGYSFVDTGVVPDVFYQYMLVLIGDDGTYDEHITEPVKVGSGGPVRWFLPLIMR